MIPYSLLRAYAAKLSIFTAENAGLWILALSFLFVTGVGWAKDEELIILESDEIEDKDLPRDSVYWDQHFSGALIGAYGGIGDSATTRWNTQMRLRFDEDIEPIKLVLEGRAYRSFVEFALEQTREGLEREEIVGTVDVNDVELLESYVDLDANRLVLSAGRKRVVFGQFDLLSPIDLALPIDFGSSTLSFSKLDNRLPQDTISAQLFLPSRFELHYYYFPQLVTSAFSDTLNHGVTYDDMHGMSRVAAYRDPQDESQQALRFLYVGPAFTMGITGFQGYNYFAQDFVSLVRDSDGYRCQDGTTGQGGTCLFEMGSDGFYVTDFIHRPEPSLPMNKMFGFEISVPVHSTTYKLEWSRNELQEDIWQVDRGSGPVYKAYLDWVRTENEGREYIDVVQNLYAFGFDYYSVRRLINFSLLLFEKQYDSHARRGRDLAMRSGFDDGGDTQAIPVFHIAGNYGDEWNHRVGWVLGGVGFAEGTSLYYQNTAIESMLLWLSLDILNYRNDNNIVGQVEEEEREEQDDNEIDVDRIESRSIGLRLGLSYSF